MKGRVYMENVSIIFLSISCILLAYDGIKIWKKINKIESFLSLIAEKDYDNLMDFIHKKVRK
jgi:hypothetical protein